MPTSDIIQRVTEWLASLVDNPAAAAELAENPGASLANHDLSQSDLDGVDLRSVAGGLGGSAGVSPEGRAVLTQFAESPPSSHHVSPIHQVSHVTQAAHHDNPQVTRIFQDNSVNIDNSQTFVNNGFVGGDISFDNDVNVAQDGGVIANQNSGPVVAATQGSVAAGDDVTQAKNSTVLQSDQEGGDGNGGDGNGIPANNDRGDQGDPGRQQDGQEDRSGHEDNGGHDGQDLPFGEGAGGHGQQEGQDQHDQDGQHDGKDGDHEENPEDGDHEDDGSQDPTAEADHQPELDPTHGDSEPEPDQHSQHFQPQVEPEGDHGPGADHPPLDDHLLDA
jgi:hypothetical protein